MLIENAGKTKWLEAVSEPSLTAFTRLAGPESAMNSVRFDSVYIGSSKHLKRGLFQ
jgi:hypothetical protein